MNRPFRAFPVLTLALLLTPALLTAQDAWRRDGRWEYTITPLYSLPAGIDIEGGTRMDTSGGLGLAMGLGYNFDEQWNLAFEFQGGWVDYDADLVDADHPSQSTRISSSYAQWSAWFGGDFNLLARPITPYLSGALGYSWFDPNIPNGLPHPGCWWDPWYGYTCADQYPVTAVSAFSYRAGLGLRWDFNREFFMKAGYEMQWHQLDHSEGDPGIGVWTVDFGFFF